MNNTYSEILSLFSTLPLDDKEALLEDLGQMVDVEIDALGYDMTPEDQYRDEALRSITR